MKERAIRGLRKREVGIGVDGAAAKEIEIETRGARHRQHESRGGFDGDHRPFMPFEHLLRRFLQTDIDGEEEILPRYRIPPFQDLQSASPHIRLDMLVAHPPAQQILVRSLEPDLADPRLTTIGVDVDPPEIAIVDPTDIADHMRPHRTEGIVPSQPRAHVDPREKMTIDLETRPFPIFEPKAQRHALGAPRTLHGQMECTQILVRRYR